MNLGDFADSYIYELIFTSIISGIVSTLTTLFVQYISKKINVNIKIKTSISIYDLKKKSLAIQFNFENPSNVYKRIDNIEVIKKNRKNEEEKLIQCCDQKMNLFGEDEPLVSFSDNNDKNFSLYLHPKSFERIVLKFESFDQICNEDDYFIKFNNKEYKIKLTHDPNEIQKLGEK